MDEKSLLPLLRRWWRPLLVGAVLGGLAGNYVANRSAPTYEAEVKMLVGPINTDFDTIEAAGELGRSYAEIARSRPVLRDAIRETGARTTPTVMLEDNAIRTTSNDVTRIVQITVQYGDAKTAAALANTLARRIQRLAARTPDQFTITARRLMEQPEISRLDRPAQDAVSTAAKRVMSASIGGLVTVVDPAEVPVDPVAPRVALVTAMAAIMGLIAMALILLLRESSARGIADEQSLEQLDDPAYLGAVAAPIGRRAAGAPLVVEHGPSTAVDAYRSVATKIGLFDNRPGVCSLLVLDASDGRRAGAAAANLAAVLAGADRRVLLLDANSEAGGATTVLGLDGRPGYGELVASMRGAELNGHVSELKIQRAEDFLVLPHGSGGGAAMLDVDRAQRLLDHLSADVDVIVVSAGSIEHSPSALVWSRVTDGVMLVVDEKVTTDERVGATLRSLNFTGAHVVGIVLGRNSVGRARRQPRARPAARALSLAGPASRWPAGARGRSRRGPAASRSSCGRSRTGGRSSGCAARCARAASR